MCVYCIYVYFFYPSKISSSMLIQYHGSTCSSGSTVGGVSTRQFTILRQKSGEQEIGRYYWIADAAISGHNALCCCRIHCPSPRAAIAPSAVNGSQGGKDTMRRGNGGISTGRRWLGRTHTGSCTVAEQHLSHLELAVRFVRGLYGKQML